MSLETGSKLLFAVVLLTGCTPDPRMACIDQPRIKSRIIAVDGTMVSANRFVLCDSVALVFHDDPAHTDTIAARGQELPMAYARKGRRLADQAK